MNKFINPFQGRRSDLRELNRKDDQGHLRRHVLKDYEPMARQGTGPDFQIRARWVNVQSKRVPFDVELN